jgi:predicted secreted protein
MYQARDADNPLLIIYTIDKNSDVSIQARQAREKLFRDDQQKQHVIGLAIAFPETNETEEERRRHSTDFWALGGVKNEPEIEPEGDS